MENKLQKPYTTSYNLLKGQNLSQAHYQILLKEFTEFNVNTNMMIKIAKLVQTNSKNAKAVLNTQAVQTIQQNTNVYVAIRITYTNTNYYYV